MKMTTGQAAPFIPDNSLDICFIDAAHGYPYVLKDLRLWMPKMKEGGIICGHDYFPEQLLVKRAVDEFFPADKVNLYLEDPTSPRGGNHIWWVEI